MRVIELAPVTSAFMPPPGGGIKLLIRSLQGAGRNMADDIARYGDDFAKLYAKYGDDFHGLEHTPEGLAYLKNVIVSGSGRARTKALQTFHVIGAGKPADLFLSAETMSKCLNTCMDDLIGVLKKTKDFSADFVGVKTIGLGGERGSLILRKMPDGTIGAEVVRKFSDDIGKTFTGAPLDLTDEAAIRAYDASADALMAGGQGINKTRLLAHVTQEGGEWVVKVKTFHPLSQAHWSSATNNAFHAYTGMRIVSVHSAPAADPTASSTESSDLYTDYMYRLRMEKYSERIEDAFKKPGWHKFINGVRDVGEWVPNQYGLGIGVGKFLGQLNAKRINRNNAVEIGRQIDALVESGVQQMNQALDKYFDAYFTAEQLCHEDREGIKNHYAEMMRADLSQVIYSQIPE